MACNNCNAPTVECVDADEPSDSGLFTERYECANCGAKGIITGREEQLPDRWNRYGACFE